MKEELKDQLEEIFKNKTFSQNIYYDIFKIFKTRGEQYSNNSNGVFINLTDCKEDTIKEVFDYIQNIEKNNLEHETYLQNTEKKLDDLKKSIKDTEKNDLKIKKIKKTKKQTAVSNKILDKELQPEKIVYKGVYKRIYNNMKGYKNKTPKKEHVKEESTSIFDTEDEHHDPEIEDIDPEIEEIEEIDFEDLNKDDEDLFGEDSEED